jgi:2-dehydro-3-deoxyphosphogluconate aldolase/(4S)-4-hydroxy-2-oxoglutarate aldolase
MKIDEILKRSPVIPVIVIERPEDAVPLAQALVDGGLPVLEITLRTVAAMQAIRDIAESVEDAIVGVGTVTNGEQLREAVEAGAEFAVSPGLTDSLADASQALAVPFLPGVFTPSDVMRARDRGFNALKLFPAEQAGGIGLLKALAGPFPGTLFCPTGGIGEDNFDKYLALPNVACVGGSWVCPAEAVAAKDWNRITRLATAVSDAAPAHPTAASSDIG